MKSEMKYTFTNTLQQQRDKDLMRVYHELISSAKEIRMMNIYEQIVMRPAKRFWVSEERAAVVIAAMMNGNRLQKMRKTKREMFQEIFKRAMRIKKRNPNMTPFELATLVVKQPAPKFYLTAVSARIYILNVKKKWYEERRKKLRHLFC